MESSPLDSLRPRRVVEIIDRTFRVYRDNWITFIGLVALVSVPSNLLSFVVDQSSRRDPFTTDEFGRTTVNSTSTVGSLVVLLIRLLSSFLIAVVINSIITYVTSENLLGRKKSIAEAFSVVVKRWLPLTGAYFLLGIIFVVCAIALTILTLCLIGLLGWPVLIYYIFCASIFLAPILILEDTSVTLGIRRAVALARTRFWAVFGFAFGVAVIIYVLQLTFTILSLILVGVTFSSNNFMESTDANANFLSTLLTTIVSIFITPILPIGVTLMYYDTRIRVEGLDIALQALDTAEPSPADVESPEPQTPLIVGNDVLNIFILTVALLAICGALYGMLFLVISLVT